ncbi:MAG: toprim domain-containing protein [Planctomycetes bacterium]|nr:toprim domain-containing protein [Planctomycetota bacterium]
MAPGSRKDLGFFSTGDPAAYTVLLCESAIDAVSGLAIFHDTFCVSTSGATNHPRWLHALLRPNRLVYCGFDADEPGDRLANALIAQFPNVLRRRPAAHDWNDQLRLPNQGHGHQPPTA